MLVLENASSENAGSKKCRHWKMSVAENAGTGKRWYRKMPVLKMPLLENAGTGKSWYWKMSVLEIANTVRSQVKFILPYAKSTQEGISEKTMRSSAPNSTCVDDVQFWILRV